MVWLWSGDGLVSGLAWLGRGLAVVGDGLAVVWHGLAVVCHGLAVVWECLAVVWDSARAPGNTEVWAACHPASRSSDWPEMFSNRFRRMCNESFGQASSTPVWCAEKTRTGV